MAEFAVNVGYFAEEYNTWFADEHGHEPCVTFDIFTSHGTYLCGSESFLNAICRAKKSPNLERMEQMTVHIVLMRVSAASPRGRPPCTQGHLSQQP